MRILVIAVVSAVLPALCASAQAPRRYSVALDVTCADEGVKAELESYFSRELRSLGDVDITAHKPEYKITIVATKTSNRGGTDTGVAFAYTFIEYQREELDEWVKDKDAPVAQYIIRNFSEKEVTHVLGVESVGPDSLKIRAQKLVAEFDTQLIKPERQFSDSLQNAARKALGTAVKKLKQKQ